MKKQIEKPEEKKPDKVQLLPLKIRTAKIGLVGITPLLSHKFGDTAKDKILNKQQQKSQQREKRNIEQEVKEATYFNSDGKDCVPAAAFKNALVEACVYLPGLDKKLMKGSVHIKGSLIPLKFKRKVVNEATVKINRGMSGEVRFRPEYQDWSVEVELMFNESLVSIDQIINCLNYAGFHIGVGDWRPQRSGSYGTFRVETK